MLHLKRNIYVAFYCNESAKFLHKEMFARLFVDILLVNQGLIRFSRGSKNLSEDGRVRKQYIDALKSADNGNYSKLLKFVEK